MSRGNRRVPRISSVVDPVVPSWIPPMSFPMQIRGLLIVAIVLLAVVLGVIVWMVVSRRRHRREHYEFFEYVEELAHQDKLATLGLLAASIGHEINNVISVVKMRLYLARQQADEEVADEIEGAVEAITRLEELSEHLSMYVEEEGDEGEGFGLGEAIEGALDVVEPKIRSGLELEVDIEAEPEVVGCRGSFIQVVVNLLLNAYDAVEGVEEARIGLWAERRGDRAVVTVIDNGPGIEVDRLEAIFEPFFTTKEGDREGGSGIGLWLCRQIVQREGGEIRAENREEGGARFVVVVPVVSPERAGEAVGAGPEFPQQSDAELADRESEVPLDDNPPVSPGRIGG